MYDCLVIVLWYCCTVVVVVVVVIVIVVVMMVVLNFDFIIFSSKTKLLSPRCRGYRPKRMLLTLPRRNKSDIKL